MSEGQIALLVAIIASIATVIGAFITATGKLLPSPESQANAMKQFNDVLQADNARLRTENVAMEKQNRDLELVIVELRRQNEQLHLQNVQLLGERHQWENYRAESQRKQAEQADAIACLSAQLEALRTS